MAEGASPGCHSRATQRRFVGHRLGSSLCFFNGPCAGRRALIGNFWLSIGIPMVKLHFCKTVRSLSSGMCGSGAGIDPSRRELLLEDAGIRISEALRGRVCRGSVNGIAMRGWRGASAACLRYSEVVTGCALAESIRSIRARRAPPVPLIVPPFESVDPEPLTPADDPVDVPPELCARA